MIIQKKFSVWAVVFALLALGSMSCREHACVLKKTPAVQKILNQRKARVPELQALKAKGLIGENNNGFITILKPALSPAEKALVEAENRSRKFIYNTVVAQNHLEPDGLVKVEKQFAKTRHALAKKGDLIQGSSGKWVRK